MTPKRIDSVRIEAGDQLVAIPWKTAQKLRGELISDGANGIAEQFAANR